MEPFTILLVEDDPRVIFAVQSILQTTSKLISLKIVINSEEAIAYLNGNGRYRNRSSYPFPLLILIDWEIPQQEAAQLLEWLKNQPAKKGPAAAVLIPPLSPTEINKAHTLGADTCVFKPLTADSLMALFDELSIPVEKDINILLVDDNPDFLVLSAQELAEEFHNLQIDEAGSLDETQAALDRCRYDMVVTASKVNGVEGITILQAIKAKQPECTVMMLVEPDSEQMLREAINFGLDDFEFRWPGEKTPIANMVRIVLAHAKERQSAMKAERQYSALFHDLSIGVFRMTLDGHIIEANPTFRKILGFSEQQILLDTGGHIFSLLGDETRRWLRETFLHQKSLLNLELPINRQDNTTIWVEISANIINDREGQPLYYEGTLQDITSRLQIEKSLRENQRMLATLLGNLPGIAYRCRYDRNWTMEFMSEGCLPITGYPAEDFIGNASKAYNDIIHPDDRETVWNEIEKVLAQRKAFQLVYRIITAQEEIKWVWEQGRGVFSDEGNLVALEGYIADITERIKTEEALRQKTEELDKFFNISLDLLSISDINGQFRRLNKAWEKTLGFSTRELLESGPLAFVHPDDITKTREAITALANNKELVEFINRYRCKDGSYRWIEWSAAPAENMSYGAARDITERRQSEAALQESEEKFRQLFEAVSEAIFLIDNETGIIYEANAGAAEMYGYSREELRRMKNTDLSAEPDKTRWAMVTTAIHIPTRWHRKKDGTVFPVEINASHFTWRDRPVHIAAIRDISERFATETALRESEEKFRSFIEQSLEGISLVDEKGMIIEWNRAAEIITGLAPAKVKNKPFWEIARSIFNMDEQNTPESNKAAVLLALQAGQSALFETPLETVLYRGPKREMRFIQMILFPIRGEGGYRIGLVMRDITEHKRSDELIQWRNRELAINNEIMSAASAGVEIESLLQIACRELALAMNMPHVAAVLMNEQNTEGLLVAEYVDKQHQPSQLRRAPIDSEPAATFLLGLKKPEVIDDPVNDPRLGTIAAELSRHEETSLLIVPIMKSEPRNGCLLLESKGRRNFSAEEISLAERVADQASAAVTQVKLAQTQQRLMTAIEQAQEMVIITDIKGKILYVNPAFEKVSGYSQAEVIGQDPSILKSDKHERAFYDEMWSSLKAGKVWRGRFENRKKDGEIYFQESAITPIRKTDGEIINYVEVAHDVTHELELEKQYFQSQKMEAIGQLTAGIAYDFNNLLTAMNGFAELARLQLPPGHTSQESLEKVLHSGRMAAELVQQLLAFSHKQVISPKIVSLNQIVMNMEKMLRRIIGEQIELETRLSKEPWQIKADQTQIEQIIINLAVNARDAMPEGGHLLIETANVELDEDYATYHLEVIPGPYVLLAVSDNGHGMSPEVKAHIFEPFFTTKGRGKGTGLGMATIYGIVKQSGGHIWFYSEEGMGTTFRIYLPRSVDAKKVPGEGLLKSEIPGGSETILLVEDDENVREVARLILIQQGYTVLEAIDGNRAMEIARSTEEPIHLLLTDVVMRGMGGKELSERIVDVRPGIKILLMSGYADDIFAHKPLLEEGISFLQKPFSPGELANKVRQALERQD